MGLLFSTQSVLQSVDAPTAALLLQDARLLQALQPQVLVLRLEVELGSVHQLALALLALIVSGLKKAINSLGLIAEARVGVAVEGVGVFGLQQLHLLVLSPELLESVGRNVELLLQADEVIVQRLQLAHGLIRHLLPIFLSLMV